MDKDIMLHHINNILFILPENKGKYDEFIALGLKKIQELIEGDVNNG